MSETTSTSTEELYVTRILDAAVETVWKAWTEPDQVRRWWGPKGYSSPSCRIDLRVGGKYVFAMQAPADQGGQVSYTSGVFERIEPMKLLEFTQGLSDADGNRINPQKAGMPADFPKEMHTTIRFRPRGDMTELTIRMTGWSMGQMYVYALAGTQQQTDKLSAVVSRDR